MSQFLFSFFFFGQRGGTSRWRVCYQPGLLRLVCLWLLLESNEFLTDLVSRVIIDQPTIRVLEEFRSAENVDLEDVPSQFTKHLRKH